ncbi:hypothetical protein [uncultured Gammaproteobacteria bacterium]|nr:Fic/DOC family N-terminal domain-containing protein [thiotrophic endosymbiont of Bathymodiolus puteoserpentis (Logatchev)]CAC9598482.1 hypothetical protein [uncultured Gammaproteobacteria bacterium]
MAILNETAKSAPNRFILINALTFQEAKGSSEIENIAPPTMNFTKQEQT